MRADRSIVLFDGVCNLCNRAVNFIIDHDPDGRFGFASLQSEEARALMKKHGRELPAGDPDTMILVQDGKVYERSAAAVRIAGRMSGWPKLGYLFIVVPWFLRDLGYSFIAKRRYRWFGKRDECRVPTPELRERFLS